MVIRNIFHNRVENVLRGHSWVAYFEHLFCHLLLMVHIVVECAWFSWESHCCYPVVLISVSDGSMENTSWLSDGHPNQISVGHVISLFHFLCKPTILSPSEEAAISS